MAATVAATATGDSGATNVSDHPITLPAGTGKVIVMFACDGGSGSEHVTSSTGWTRRGYEVNGTNVAGSVFESTGESPGALVVNTVLPGTSTPSVEQSSHVSARLTAASAGTVSVLGNGAAAVTNPDPPALTPAGGSQAYLWLAGLAVDANPTTSNTITAPTGYATATQRAATGSNGAFAALTSRSTTAASEDPGTWTLATAEQHVVFTISVAPAGAPPPTVTPGTALRITGPDNSNNIGNNHFNLGIGFRSNESGPYQNHTDITPAQIAAGYEHPTYFVYKLNADGIPCVEFNAPLDGGRTSQNTEYSRSELREFERNNSTKSAWDPKSGTHWIEGWSRVTVMTPVNKPQVCIAQAHDAADDTVMILVQKKSGGGLELKLRFNGSATGLPTLDSNYQVGREFFWRIEFVGGQCRVYYYCPATGAGSTTTPIATTSAFSSAAAGWYYKCGAYNQTNLTTDPGGGTIKVQMRDLRHFHTGWAQPMVPYSTDAGSGGSGTPTVEAGAAGTVEVGAVFQRTATETQSAQITGRSWQILSGPAGGGQVIGTGATLNWNPSTAGSYSIGYTASYAGGSATDTIAVTVTGVGGVEPEVPGDPVWPSQFPDGTPYPTIGSGSRIINVSTASALQAAMNAAVAGDRIRLASGTYSGNFTMSGKRGTGSNGISIESATLLGAVLASGSTIRLTDCSHVTVVGLSLPYDAMNGVDTISLRGTGSYIHLRDILMGPSALTVNDTVAGNFIFVGDDVRHVRIDGCELRNKGTSGNGIRVYGNFTSFQGCQYVRIDHNLFRDIGPEVGNDKEPVRLGVSTMSRTQGNHVCERNVFLRCRSEPECFSGKMGRIRLTGNVFKDCTGGPVLRHGIACVLADNYIIDTANSTGSLGTRSGGPRFYDSDHYVGYNTIMGTRGVNFQAALLMDTGDAEGSSTNLSAHWRVIRATVERNWISGCATGIQVGDNYTSAPSACNVNDNLVSATDNTTAISYVGGITASQIGTVANNTYAATPGAHGAVMDANGIWRKAGYGSRVTYLLSTDVGPNGAIDADLDGTGNGTGTGGGGNPGGDTPPSVEVGSAASVATGNLFTRSATESGSNINLREWTIASAPAGATGSEVAGTVIGNGLTLSWPAPATLGSYTLRYTAANSVGVDSADLVVTVIAADVVVPSTPPQFVSVAGAPASGLQSIVDPDPPPGVQPGDFQIMAIQISGNETMIDVPADWFPFPGGGNVTSPSTPVDRGGVSTSLMYYNTTGATEAVWEKSGTRFFQAIRAAYRGHTSVGEMKVVLEANGAGTRDHLSPVVTPVRPNSRVVAVAMSDLINFSAGPWQAPAGWTMRYDNTVSGGGVAAGLEYQSIAIADTLFTGGATAPPPPPSGGSDFIMFSSSEIQDAPTSGTPYTTALATADLAIPAVDFSGSGSSSTTRPVIRSSSADGQNNAPTSTPVKPTGLEVGDYLLAFQQSDADGQISTLTAPAGFTVRGSSTGGTNLPDCKIWGKVATASDVSATSFAFPDQALGNSAVVLVAIVAGTYNTTTPTTTPVWTTNAAPGSPSVVAPAVTGVVDGLLLTGHMADTGGVNRSWGANPAGMTLVNSARAPISSWVLNGVWSEPLTSTASTGTRTATVSANPNGYAAASLIMNPATGGTVTPTSAAIAYAAALQYAKTGTTSYKTKVDTALAALPAASTTSLLGVARQLPGYMIAADLVGYQDSTFQGFAALIRSKAIAGGLYGDITTTSRKAPNYQGMLSLAARATASAYLNDTTDLDQVATIFRRWTGEDRAGWTQWEPTADHDDSWVDAVTVNPGWPVVSGNVFVAPAPLGNDSNNGLSDTAPKLTIAAGINAAAPGQTVLVAAGVYTGNVSTPKGGTLGGGYIRVRSEDLWGAQIVGETKIQHEYVTLEGFDIGGAGSYACDVTANNTKILNNKIHNVGKVDPDQGSGIEVYSADGNYTPMSNIIVDGNVVFDIGGAPGSNQLQQGIYVSTAVTNGIVSNNLVFDVCDFGLHAFHSPSGWRYLNNTVANCGRGILTGPNFVVRNNISYANGSSNFDVRGSGNVLSNNLAFGTGGGSGITGVSVADPRFVNPTASINTADYRLQAGSPAIGGGTSTDLPATDIVGVPRPQPTIGSGGTGDVGCYEMPSTSATQAGVNGPDAPATKAGAIVEDIAVGPAHPNVDNAGLTQSWEALGAASIVAKILERAGYGQAFLWGSEAIRRAAEFIHAKVAGTTGVTLTGTVFFQDSFESNGFGNFAAIQSVLGHDDTPNTWDQTAYRLKVVNAGTGHETAARFEIRDGDSPPGDTTERMELVFPSGADVDDGDERWYQFDVRLGDPTWTAPTSWEVIWQWHHSGSTGSPPLEIGPFADGTVKLSQDGLSSPPTPITLWTITPGQWERVVIHVKWSNTSSVGFFEVWVNGTQVVSKTIRRTMVDSGNYMKCGIYRDGSHTSTQVVMFDNIKVTESATVGPTSASGAYPPSAATSQWVPYAVNEVYDLALGPLGSNSARGYSIASADWIF